VIIFIATKNYSMKFYLHLLVVIYVFASCSGGPNGDPVPEPPVLPSVVLPDTLSTGWSTAVPPSSTEIYSDIFFADNNTGYLIGGSNAYKSTNGGLTWFKLFSAGHDVGFGHIAAANANRACFVGSKLTTFITQNAGSTIDSTDYSYNGEIFQDGFFSSANTCYLSSETSIWKSTNGGTNFTRIFSFGGGSHFSTFSFLDDNTGFISNSYGIFKTTNGGVAWTKIRNLNLSRPESIQFLNATTGFYSDENALWKTTDGGTGWTKIYEIPAGVGTSFNDMDFIDSNVGYFVAGRLVLKTIDGGAHWEPVIRSGSLLIEIHFTDATHGWACGANGKVFVYRP
jgi:photosystem II stability/assembly factor-like uncharacterized protein